MLSTPLATSQTATQLYLATASGQAIAPNQSLLPLTATVRDQNYLQIGGCDVVELVRQFGSPLYILDEATLRTACRQYRDAFAEQYPGDTLVLYASKAWNCLAVCAIAADAGLGIDVVSGGELYTAVQAGVNPEKLYLHGNNKSRQELELAIEVGCTIVVDNWLELDLLADIAVNLPDEALPIRMMLRCTPGIECHTHEYIRTGHLDSKFGFDPDQLEDVFAAVAQARYLNCVGLHAHIGSQIFDLQAHQDLPLVMVGWMQKAAAAGLPVQELDLGGGLGMRYTESDDPPSIAEWARVLSSALVDACEQNGMALPRLIVEPGRSLIGPACVTAYTIGSRKQVPNLRTYVTVDGGMSDNPRPITYQSLYRAVVANRMAAPLAETVAIGGKHCESGDIVIPEIQLPSTQPGDILIVMGTGAYNYSMSSNYNRLPRPAAVLVNQGEASIILQRETYDDLLRCDRLPERLISSSCG
jgi:diaminopimelate decarboxylase